MARKENSLVCLLLPLDCLCFAPVSTKCKCEIHVWFSRYNTKEEAAIR